MAHLLVNNLQLKFLFSRSLVSTAFPYFAGGCIRAHKHRRRLCIALRNRSRGSKNEPDKRAINGWVVEFINVEGLEKFAVVHSWIHGRDKSAIICHVPTAR